MDTTSSLARTARGWVNAGAVPVAHIRSWRLRMFLIGSGLSCLAGALQIPWRAGTFSLAHSLGLWFLIALIASTRGSIAQSFVTATAVLAASVIAFYASWTITDRLTAQHTGASFGVYNLAWACAAPLAAALTAVLAAWWRRPGLGSGCSAGVSVGFLLGDVIVARVGSGWSQIGPKILADPDVLTVLAAAASINIIVFTARFNGSGQAAFPAVAGFVAGLPVGYLLADAPIWFHAIVDQIF